MKKILIGVPYLAAVVGANLLVSHFGPSSTPYVAFGVIAAVLIFRDQFADLTGPQRAVQQGVLILAGAALTWFVNRSASIIAEASVISFIASESLEGVLYFLMRRLPWVQRAPRSGMAGAAVDSVLFISIAFGFSLPLVVAQFFAKGFGAYVWSEVIGAFKSHQPTISETA